MDAGAEEPGGRRSATQPAEDLQRKPELQPHNAPLLTAPMLSKRITFTIVPVTKAPPA